MTVQVQPKAFSDALKRVVGAVEHSKTMPILAHIMITTSGGFMTLRTTDLNVEITTTIDCDGDLPPTCAPADRLQATIARILDRGSAAFSVDGQNLVVASGRSRFTMPTIAADQFPSIKMKDVGCTFLVEGKALAALFNSCAVALPTTDESRPYLNGVHMFAGTINEGADRRLCGIATDGYKLSAREVPADLPSDVPSIIVPRKAVLTLAKMVAGWDEIEIEITETRFIAAFGPTKLTTKLIEGTYPDWRRIKPRVEPRVSYDNAPLAAAVTTAFSGVHADKKNKGLKLNFTESETEFSIQNMDGTAGGTDACPHSLLSEMPTETLGFKPKLLLDLIEALGGDTIQIGFADASSAVLVTCPNFSDRWGIVMPLRV